MAQFYADEQFPFLTVESLRKLEHDVLTVQDAGKAGLKIPDEEVLAFATCENRAVLTLNRRDFIRLHKLQPNHAGIIVCKDDPDKYQIAVRIHTAISVEESLIGRLIRVNRV